MAWRVMYSEATFVCRAIKKGLSFFEALHDFVECALAHEVSVEKCRGVDNTLVG